MSSPKFTTQQKAIVAQRARNCCEYCLCQARFSPDPFSVEHIIPRSKAGSDDLQNLAFACQGCNNRKYVQTDATDAISGKKVPLYNPRLQSWEEHFAWSQNFTLIIGLTPIGRATVERLQLNRDGVVNLRRVLVQAKEHPPSDN